MLTHPRLTVALAHVRGVRSLNCRARIFAASTSPLCRKFPSGQVQDRRPWLELWNRAERSGRCGKSHGLPDSNLSQNEVCNIGHPAFRRLPHPYLCSLKNDFGVRSDQRKAVIDMEDPRCKIVAVEMDELRSRSPLNGMLIAMEDLRCRSLPNRATLEIEYPRCHCVQTKMDDPRCNSLHLKW